MAGTFHKCLALYSTMYVYFSICTKTQGLERVWCLLSGCFCNMEVTSGIQHRCFYECFHCWLQPLITGPAVMWWVDVIICSQDICINSPGSTVLLSVCLAKEIGNWTLWHHYGTWNWSSWYFLQLQMDFCPLENCGNLSFPSLISLLLFVAFRVPSAMWGICGRQWAERPHSKLKGSEFSLQFFFWGESWKEHLQIPHNILQLLMFFSFENDFSWNTCWLIALLTPCLRAVGHNLRPTSPTQDPSNAKGNGIWPLLSSWPLHTLDLQKKQATACSWIKSPTWKMLNVGQTKRYEVTWHEMNLHLNYG